MTYFPPDYTHNLLPIDAQQMLRGAAAKPSRDRLEAIDKAAELVRKVWPGCFRGSE